MVDAPRIVVLAHEADFDGWREAARALALAGVSPADVRWKVGGEAEGRLPDAPAATGFSVPRPFIALARSVVQHEDPERFALLYAFLLKLRARPNALAEGGDPLLQRLERMRREARGKEFGRRTLEDAEPAMGTGDNLQSAWKGLRTEAKACTRCHLYKIGSQVVFGEGPLAARIMFVGEQPGDQEDLADRPFVGPAGQVLDRALKDAGLDRTEAYVTNAVKHFKFERRGKRRIHQKPDGPEIEACRWWMEQERLLVRPAVTVALGATAARSLFGKAVTITAMRGKPHQLYDGGECWVTVHPSYLLRIPEQERKEAEYTRFVEDLGRVRKRLATLAA